MSKKLIAIVAIVIVIGGLVGALYLVQNMEEPASSAPGVTLPDVIYVLGESGSQQVAATVTVQNEHGSYTIVNEKPGEPKNAGNYTVQGFEGLVLNGYQVMGAADRATNLTALSIVAEEGASLADFGLDKPSTTVSATYQDGSKATLLFGNPAPGGSGIYAMREGNPTVYLLPETSAAYFTGDKFSLLDLGLTTGDSQSSTIQSIRLGGTLRPSEIVVEATPDAVKDVAGQMLLNTHAITAPIHSTLHMTHGLEPLHTVFGLRADKAVAKIESEADLAPWGLAEPYSTVAVESETDGSFQLSVSKPDADGNCYLMKDGTPVVYQVAASSMPWLELDTFRMMEKLVVLPFIDSIDSIKVTQPSRSDVIKLFGEEDELTVEINGQEYADVKNFRSFYQNLLAASYDSYTEESIPAGARLLLRYEYIYRDGSVNTVSFYEGAARKVFVQLDDQSPMYAASSYVDRLQKDTIKLVNGETVVTVM